MWLWRRCEVQRELRPRFYDSPGRIAWLLLSRPTNLAPAIDDAIQSVERCREEDAQKGGVNKSLANWRRSETGVDTREPAPAIGPDEGADRLIARLARKVAP